MGLAPYGKPIYVDKIINELMDLKEDGTFRLNMDCFNYATGLTMTNRRFENVFGQPARKPESEITQFQMDIARSIQAVTEEIVLRLTRTVQRETGCDYLCMAGGVALNCVANGRVLRESPFKDIWIQPAAGDAGGALGAAYSAWFEYLDNERPTPTRDAMSGAYLGPRADFGEISEYLESVGAAYRCVDDDAEFVSEIAQVLENENVVGWYQGRMEYGPRALGARSIIGDARSSKMQTTMNLKIKYRESFRPFAPVVRADDVSDWFEIDRPSPYMLLVSQVKESRLIEMTSEQSELFGIDKLKVQRSEIPAVTHVDYSARIQTVHKDTNPRFYDLLSQFKQRTGCPVLINTSFNVRGEPIVCTPEDAYRCFMRTEMDYLVLENFILAKTEQPEWDQDDNWKDEFQLD